MDLRPAEFLARYSHAEDRPPFRDYNGGVDIVLRDFRQQDFDTLWGIDQVCFVAGIAYSRRELGLYIRQPRSFTLVAESASGGQQSPVNAKTNATDSVIVGFLVAEAHRAAGHLITIDVLPQARRAGWVRSYCWRPRSVCGAGHAGGSILKQRWTICRLSPFISGTNISRSILCRGTTPTVWTR